MRLMVGACATKRHTPPLLCYVYFHQSPYSQPQQYIPLDDMSGLDTCINLHTIDLHDTQVNDVLGLATRSNLRMLDFDSTQVSAVLGLTTCTLVCLPFMIPRLGCLVCSDWLNLLSSFRYVIPRLSCASCVLLQDYSQ